jgi:hypothetical protein
MGQIASTPRLAAVAITQMRTLLTANPGKRLK